LIVGSFEAGTLLRGQSETTLWSEALESHALELAQIAQFLQVREALGPQFLNFALAGIELAEIGVAKGHVLDQKSSPFANRTNVVTPKSWTL
jgi:hypothetical protein